jgi:hypothetical protein
MSKIEVNQISSQCGSTLTVGQSGDTVTLAAGATAAGFGSTGEVSWDTTKKTSGFTTVSGVGYFCDTTSAAFTVTLPATPSAGNVVAVSDYTGTFGTNNLTIGRNGSNINGAASDYVIYQNNTTAQFIYVDATEGWRLVFTGANSDLTSNFIVATGGTITCCGDYKIHTFTGPGTFTVTSAGNPIGSTTVDYMVVAGGGGGGVDCAGGAGGAGGFRESSGAASGCYTASPLGACVSALPVTAQGYPIIVGGGGAGEAGSPGPRPGIPGCAGSNSVFSTITSNGGGGGGSGSNGANGGSGGGASHACSTSGGSGNTPPVSPPQGNNGSVKNSPFNPGSIDTGGGGGGAGAAAPAPPGLGTGGDGVTTSISASPTSYAGGGGGGIRSTTTAPSGGLGGGGDGGTRPPSGAAGAGQNGTANTGGGGGGIAGSTTSCKNVPGGTGGSGIVIIRYKFQ